jgi:tRNA A64-2'-O-ribosylphosphate transferase
MSNPHYSELIFPTSEQPSISHLLASLKRSTLSIHNRLTSIRADAEFVARVAEAFKSRPLVANERCGSWYVPPERKDGSAYFKSTDGHERAWKFSTRRLNLHLIDMVEKNDGYFISMTPPTLTMFLKMPAAMRK